MKNRIIIFLFSLIINISLKAQIGGNATYNFLEMTISPFSSALGGKIISNPLTKETIFLNPALLSKKDSNNVSFIYKSYLAKINIGMFSYTFNQKKIGNFAFGIHYANYGKFDQYDAFGNYYGQFTASDYIPYLTYSFHADSLLNIGVNLKIIYSQLETYYSFGYSIDLGMFYKVNEQTNFALVARNIGRQVKPYYNTYEPLPLNISVGITNRLKYAPFILNFTFEYLNKWNIRFDSYLNSLYKPALADTISLVYKASVVVDEIMRHLNLGTQLIFSPKFHILFGYNFRRAKELALPTRLSLNGLSLGLIINTDKLSFTYSLEKISLLSVHSFGITLNLNSIFYKF